MMKGQGVFFVVAPFCSCPVSLVSRFSFAVVPGCARAGTQRGFSFPCLSPGPEPKKSTLGGVAFFALASPKGRDAQRGATKKNNTLHTRGRQQKKNLETNDTGHEQKEATTKRKKPRLTAALDRDAH